MIRSLRVRRPRRVGAALAASTVCLLALGSATPALASGGVFANLDGANEVPGPGDPDGAGAAIVTLYPRTGKICAKVSVARIGEPVAGHIHAGRAGVAGPVVVTLTGVTGGPQCTDGVNKALVRAIRDHPARFYVNVHTAAYPEGAVRGQLQG